MPWFMHLWAFLFIRDKRGRSRFSLKKKLSEKLRAHRIGQCWVQTDLLVLLQVPKLSLSWLQKNPIYTSFCITHMELQYVACTETWKPHLARRESLCIYAAVYEFIHWDKWHLWIRLHYTSSSWVTFAAHGSVVSPWAKITTWTHCRT